MGASPPVSTRGKFWACFSNNLDETPHVSVYGVAGRAFPRKHSYLMLIYKFLTLLCHVCQPWTSIHSCLPFDRGCLQRPQARCCMALSASSITSTSIPFLASPDLAVQHVQGGGLHTWNSGGGSVYLHCARSSIRNTVPILFPSRFSDCSLDPWTGDIVRIAPNEVIISTSRMANRDSLPSFLAAPLCKTDGV